MTQLELEMYDDYVTSDNKFFVPAVWAATLAYKSRRDGRIKFDDSCNEIIKVPRGLQHRTLNSLGVVRQGRRGFTIL